MHWDAINAWVCTQCGEPFFETHQVERLQRALEALAEVLLRHRAEA